MKRGHGYTLIEVLIVVVIIGIASAIVVPHMLTASTMGIQAAARTMIADLLYAQNEAVVQQRIRRVVVDTTLNRYWLEDENGTPIQLDWRVGSGPSGAGNAMVDFASDARFRGISLATVTVSPSGVPTFNTTGGQVVYEFDELGSPTKGGGASVGVVAGSQRFYVRVASITGRVTVHAADVVP